MNRTQTGIRGFRRNTVEERIHDLWQRIRTGATPDDCWSYEGSRAGEYPTFLDGERMEYVHRFMYRLFHGPIPPGKEVDHTCHNKGCPNPRHLEAVTHQVNNQRATSPYCRYGHLRDGLRWDKDQFRRYCLTCNRVRAAANLQRAS